MRFIEEKLFVKVKYVQWAEAGELPLLLKKKYDYILASIDGINCIFMYVKNVIDIRLIKDNASFIMKKFAKPVVLIFKNIAGRQKDSLIKDGFAFVVEDEQIYLPFMAVLLEEKFYKQINEKVDKLYPSAQALLFHYIYQKKKDIPMKGISDSLGFSAMSISRALDQLTGLDLLDSYKDGVRVIITSKHDARDVFLKSGGYLINPIKEVKNVDEVFSDRLKKFSGQSALALMGNINPPQNDVYSVGRQSLNAYEESLDNNYIRLESWTYNPLPWTSASIGMQEQCVDILSLYAIYKDSHDERINMDIEYLLESFWRDYDR